MRNQNKFEFSDHSFTHFAVARWRDSMSRGQKSSHTEVLLIFGHCVDNRSVKSVSGKKSRGHWTSKIVKCMQSCSKGHPPCHCLSYCSARSMHDVVWICVRSSNYNIAICKRTLWFADFLWKRNGWFIEIVHANAFVGEISCQQKFFLTFFFE